MEHTKRTLFDEELDGDFLRPPRVPDQRRKKYRASVEGYFYICFSAKSQSYYRYYFELYDSLIVCREDPDSEEKAVMDIKNAFVKKTSGTIINGTRYYGIRFVKRLNYEELYHTSGQVIDAWFERLKRHCILTKFRSSFESVRLIGRGNFAKVFLVRRLVDGQRFAVKVFNKAAVMSNALERRSLLYEVRMMRLMNHSRVLKLYELYEGENFVYCLCEYYKGPDLLNAIVKRGPQSEQKTLTIALQILEGLEYMHGLGVIHRDLKPENIMFKSGHDIDLVIVDLGFATHEDDLGKLFARCGTPGYVAPEVLKDRPYDCKVDVYSAGIVVYMILTGRMPFAGKSYDQVVYKNMQGVVDFELAKYGLDVAPQSKFTSSRSFERNAGEGPG